MDAATAAKVADLRDELNIQKTILASLDGVSFDGVEEERSEGRQAIRSLERQIRDLEEVSDEDAEPAGQSEQATPASTQPAQPGIGNSSPPASHSAPHSAATKTGRHTPPKSSHTNGIANGTHSSTTQTPRSRSFTAPGLAPGSPLAHRSRKRDFDATRLPSGQAQIKSQRSSPTPNSASRSGPSRTSGVIDLTGLDDDAMPSAASAPQPAQPPSRPAQWVKRNGKWHRVSVPPTPSMPQNWQSVKQSMHHVPRAAEHARHHGFGPPRAGHPSYQNYTQFAQPQVPRYGMNQAHQNMHLSGQHGMRQTFGFGNMPGAWPEESLAQRRGMTNMPYQRYPAYGPGLHRGREGLAAVIGMTAGYDYANGVDMYGRPLDDRLMSTLSHWDDSPPPEAMSEQELQELLGNIEPDVEVPPDRQGFTPEGLADGIKLYKHQTVALEWMRKMEAGSNKGGILADDMGLGKTVSTLSLMHENRAKDRTKTNLIIGPLALIQQWEEEIFKKTRHTHRLSIHKFHNVKTKIDEILSYDVVLTTYGTLSSQFTKFTEWKKDQVERNGENNIDYNDPVLAAKCPLIHPTKANFYRVILDEAQNIKNEKTKAAQGCHLLKSQYRWCLTGTPMMNGVSELFSLLKFLRIKPYNHWPNFRQAFGQLFGKKGDPRAQAMNRLQALLKAVQLRRKKDSIIDGRPIIVLPPKTEEVVYAKMNDDESDFYQQLEQNSRVLFNKYLREKSQGQAYSHILVLLLRLRQACCHPHLNLDVEDAPPPDPDMLQRLEKLAQPTVVRIKEQCAQGSFECPVCLDVVVTPTFCFPCGHHCCQQCLSKVIDDCQRDNDGKVTCVVCRAEFDPRYCFTLDAFKAVHMPEELKAEKDEADAMVKTEAKAIIDANDGTSGQVKAEDEDVDDKGNLKGFVVDDGEDGSGPSSKAKGKQRADVKEEEAEESGPVKEEKKREKRIVMMPMMPRKKSATTSPSGSQTPADATEGVKPSMLKELRKEAVKNYRAHETYMAYLRKTWLPSAKVERCIELLLAIRKEGKKTIIFSQWTLLLDLLEVGIGQDLGVKALRYDGGQSPDQRARAAQEFRTNRHASVLLVSLRAGNAGLNLTAASRVIIMDPFWNPYVEMQAVDRTYRIGQRDEVKVYRILTEGTVEDRIVALQNSKKEMVEAALDEKAGKQIGRLGMAELRYLFFNQR